MGAKDLKSNINHKRLATYGQKNASVSVAGVEVADYLGQCFVLEVGAHTADGISVKLQESDDNSAWTDISSTDLDFSTGFSQDFAVISSNDDTTYYAGYKGRKKYIGVAIVDAGSGDAILGAYVVSSFAKEIPKNI